jgi:hypothetical protein
MLQGKVTLIRHTCQGTRGQDLPVAAGWSGCRGVVAFGCDGAEEFLASVVESGVVFAERVLVSGERVVQAACLLGAPFRACLLRGCLLLAHRLGGLAIFGWAVSCLARVGSM